ncbi:hypothetical protein K466DRAFT_591632 [Polyporus arcularius HHB13444]|uniref:Uncharacterized protein n=1 Tax=Polyporus arcularius HHB13444 TaxID=1314778 RepID=A0A5C3P4X3_9APHY|nr:hypothetical protein K466DRAFT_591632 [Polyporus arcularius HHB13444]
MKGFNHLFAGVLAGHSSTQSLTGKPVLAAQDIVPGIVPSAPGPGDVFREGGKCTLSWTPDPAGLWKETNVELMSGDNWNMVHITTITFFDGTDATKTSYSYPCPEVTPNSAIYFYQFSSPAAPKNLTWTTRFTIAAADGSTTPPANDTQPDGQKIPWGVGALTDPSKAVAAPSYLGGAATASASGTGSTSGSGSSTTSSGAATTSGSSVVTSFSATTVTDGDSTTASSGAAGTTSSKSTVTQTATQSAPSTTNSAAGGNGNGAISAQTNLVVGAVAMALTAFVFGVMS